MQHKTALSTQPCGPRCEKIEKKPGCIKTTLETIGDKWTPFLVARLIDAPRSFNELSELLPGISPRTLSARLKKLEEEGILSRMQYEQHPPRFRYALTKKGTELTTILESMASWGAKYQK